MQHGIKKNPLPYLARFPEADVLTSADQVSPTVTDDRLEDWQQAGGAYNIGIFHWRPTDSSKKLAKEWKEMLLADDKIWDQNGFNELVRRNIGPPVDEDSGLVYAYDGNLMLGILPASIFCSGHTYFVQSMYQQLRLEPYATHTTFQYAGTEGKRHWLREAMVFYDPPKYYDAPGNVLLLKNSLNLSPNIAEVSQEKLLSLIAERLIDSNSNINDKDAGYAENQQQNIADAIDLLPRLTSGIDVNIKFTRIDDFEFTRECAIFGLLDIPLYHGWIVDPQLKLKRQFIIKCGFACRIQIGFTKLGRMPGVAVKNLDLLNLVLLGCSIAV